LTQVRMMTSEWLNSGAYLLDLVRGSRGPSTVTLMALLYVATWKGVELMTIVSEKLFPATRTQLSGT
jgi:hypothetical protein